MRSSWQTGTAISSASSQRWIGESSMTCNGWKKHRIFTAAIYHSFQTSLAIAHLADPIDSNPTTLGKIQSSRTWCC